MARLPITAATLMLACAAGLNAAPQSLAQESSKDSGKSDTKTTASAVDSWAPVKVEKKDGAEYCSLTDPMQKSPVKFACINHHPDCPEAEQVIQTMALYAKAYVSQDYKTCAEYMAEGITTFDEHSKKLIVGRDAVLADMKERLDKAAPDSDSPLLSYTLEDPVAKVMSKGDQAVVNCLGIKVYGGKHPRTMESHSSYVFVKEDGKWKKLHFRTDWKQVNTKS